MHLDKTASHQLRTLVACAKAKSAYVKVDKLRQAPGLNEAHMNKIVGRLVKLGLVETRSGIYGGVRLRNGVAQRPLGQVVAKLLGADMRLATNRKAKAAHGIDAALGGGYAAFIAELDRHTIASAAAAGERIRK
jgi:DNA-binding IscR family transcriptional regulator